MTPPGIPTWLLANNNHLDVAPDAAISIRAETSAEAASLAPELVDRHYPFRTASLHRVDVSHPAGRVVEIGTQVNI